MAVPVVITRPCDFPEVVEHGAGAVVEPDARQLEAALINILRAGEAERRQMGRNGQDLILARYTWETRVSALTASLRVVRPLPPRTERVRDPAGFFVIGQ